MRPSTRIPCRRVILLVVATAAIAANTVPTGASAQTPQAQDRVFTTGTTSAGVLEFGSLSFFTSIVIDARSGPSGETPSGQLSFTGIQGTGTSPIVIDFGGSVSCLSVVGNVAVIGFFQDRFFFRVRVTDGGGPGSGLDTFAVAVFVASSGCADFGGGFSETVTEGDITVVDAPPLPTSKEQCKNRGYTSFSFKNQGECVAFVQRGPKP